MMADLTDKIDKLEASHLALIREKHDMQAALRAFAEREKELVEALQWYVDEDETNEGGEWDEKNAYWLAGRNRARAILSKHKAPT